MAKQDIGLIGLAVMGQSLVLNMESKNYSVQIDQILLMVNVSLFY